MKKTKAKTKTKTKVKTPVDNVTMLREIREKLSLRHWKRPDLLKKDMERIHKKYNLNFKDSQITTTK